MATLLSSQGFSTMLVDGDFYNPCVFFHLGLHPPEIGLEEVLNKKANINDVVRIHSASGLRCVSASLKIHTNTREEKAEEIIKSMNYDNLVNEREERFKDTIKKLDYDYVIVDCAPGLSTVVEDVIDVSNELWILMTPDIPSCTAAMKLSLMVDKKKKVDKKSFILNRVTNYSYELHPREIEDLCKAKLAAVIPEDKNVPKSIAAKTPLVLESPSSPAAKAMKKFAGTCKSGSFTKNRIIFDEKTGETKVEKAPGFFARIIGKIKSMFGF
jgi:MinD-like ATPase involved in chromosome partitioning or flagellar assembly